MKFTNKEASLANDLINLPITHATWHDLKGIVELENICFGSEDAWSVLDILGVLTLPSIIRLKIDLLDSIIAFAAVELKEQKRVGWIITLGVLPQFQRKGLGKKLLFACEGVMQTKIARLSVRESNTSAINLYKSNGYKQVDTWKEYYSGKEDALILEKNLTVP